MSKLTSIITEIRTHWKNPDSSKGRYVPYREYIDIFMSEGMNYAAQAPLGYIGYAATCYIIMYHYNLPYLAFSVISLIGVPFSYLWNILGWVVADNLGFLEKKTEQKFYAFYFSVLAIGIALIAFDASSLFNPDGWLITTLNGFSGINARGFFKIFGIQLAVNSFSGARSIFWRKKLVPKHGRYKYSLYSDVIQKCITVVLIGWLPIYNVSDVNERVWMAYLLFSVFSMYDFTNKMDAVIQVISPNSQERLWIRSYPVKIGHLLNSIMVAVLPMLGNFDDINFYRWVIPGTFIPCAILTLYFVRNVKERIPQPPIEKKQKIPFWYGIFETLKNKYRWRNMLSSAFDTLGNGMISIITVIQLYTLRMSGLEYSLLGTLWAFRTTIPALLAPMFIKKYSFRTLKVFRQIIEILNAVICILAITFLGNNLTLSAAILFTAQWLRGVLVEVTHVAERDMEIRLRDYQMYLSGERLENFANVFNWILSPVSTLIGLIIPLLLLKNGFNSNWEILHYDPARFNILVVPLIFDVIGHILMLFPYLNWDYNKEQHEYVIAVLKQREELANEGYFPQEGKKDLDFERPENVRSGIPTNLKDIDFGYKKESSVK